MTVYIRPALLADSPALILVTALNSRPLRFWDGLTVDEIAMVAVTCHEAGVKIPERGTDDFGAAIAGDVEALT